MEQNDYLFILFKSFTETRDESVRLPKGKKNPQTTPPSEKPPLVYSSLKCIKFSIAGHHFLGLQPDQKVKKEEIKFHWRKPEFLFFGQWGGGLGKWGVVLEKHLLLSINCPISLLLMEKHLMKWHHLNTTSCFVFLQDYFFCAIVLYTLTGKQSPLTPWKFWGFRYWA